MPRVVKRGHFMGSLVFPVVATTAVPKDPLSVETPIRLTPAPVRRLASPPWLG